MPGQTQPCFAADPGLAGVGACAWGQQQCEGISELGTWGACAGAGQSSPEACDGVDNDCNGMTDENLGTTTCGSGSCVRTVMNCVGGVPQTCTPSPASPETCNGVDDDCNGAIDDGLGSTSCGTGPCARTVQNCVNGMPQACVPGGGSAEACNGVDDDCNGAVDDGIPSMPCSTGSPCQIGGTTCASGATSCVVVGNAPTGTPCPGGVCDMGVCHPPVNCQGSFGPCSVTCGTGTQTYTITQPAQYNGTACPYPNGYTQSCDAGACPPVCTISQYPHISWTCPSDGDHWQWITDVGCGCETYDSAGHGINCGTSYGYSVPNCVPGPISNFVDDRGSCYCQIY